MSNSEKEMLFSYFKDHEKGYNIKDAADILYTYTFEYQNWYFTSWQPECLQDHLRYSLWANPVPDLFHLQSIGDRPSAHGPMQQCGDEAAGMKCLLHCRSHPCSSATFRHFLLQISKENKSIESILPFFLSVSPYLSFSPSLFWRIKSMSPSQVLHHLRRMLTPVLLP